MFFGLSVPNEIFVSAALSGPMSVEFRGGEVGPPVPSA